MDRNVLLRMIELLIATVLCLFGILVAIGISKIRYLLGIILVSGSLHTLYHPAQASNTYDIVGGDHLIAGLSLASISEKPGTVIPH